MNFHLRNFSILFNVKKSITLLIIAANIHIIIHSALRNRSFLNKLPHFAYKQITFQGVHLSQVHQPSKKCTNRATIAPTEQQLFLKVCLCEKSAISPSRRVMRCRVVGWRLADSSFIYQLSTSRHSIFIIFIRLIISILNNDGINN